MMFPSYKPLSGSTILCSENVKMAGKMFHLFFASSGPEIGGLEKVLLACLNTIMDICPGSYIYSEEKSKMESFLLVSKNNND